MKNTEKSICTKCIQEDCEDCKNYSNYKIKIQEIKEEDKAHDEEFMNSIDEEKTDNPAKKPLTPAQQAARKKEIFTAIAIKTKRMEKSRLIGQLCDHACLNLLQEDIKGYINNDVDNDDTKEAKNGLKDLEAVLTFKKLLRQHKSEANLLKIEIEGLNKELDTFKRIQLNLFDTNENTTVDSQES